MASFLAWMGRILLFGLVLTQCFLFAFYPAKKSDLLYLTSLSYAPSVLTWTCLVLTKNAKLHWLSYTWGLYVIGLVVSTNIVFATVIDSMDKKSLLGLKVTLCITPILLLLLLNTAKDAKDHEDLLPSLCFEMAVDLVDTIARNRGHFASVINCQRHLFFKMADKNNRSQGQRFPYDILNNLSSLNLFYKVYIP